MTKLDFKNIVLECITEELVQYSGKNENRLPVLKFIKHLFLHWKLGSNASLKHWSAREDGHYVIYELQYTLLTLATFHSLMDAIKKFNMDFKMYSYDNKIMMELKVPTHVILKFPTKELETKQNRG